MSANVSHFQRRNCRARNGENNASVHLNRRAELKCAAVSKLTPPMVVRVEPFKRRAVAKKTRLETLSNGPRRTITARASSSE